VIHGRRRIALRPPRAVLIPPETPIARRLSRPVESLHIHFSAGHPYDGFAGEVFVAEVTGAWQVALEELTVRLRSRAAALAGDHVGCVLLNAVLANALACVDPRAWPARDVDPRIRAAIRFMEENPGERASNRALARTVHMSESAFIRLFSAQVGEPPRSFWRLLRLRTAGIMLQQTGLSIDQVAERCGFCDRFHFSKLFKARYGSGPAAWRAEKNLQESEPSL
jgi:AraC-like DNA-binding protein